jgi:hypothetical protein
MKKIKTVLDDLLTSLEEATENENWNDVDDLCDEFSFVVLENKAKFMRYFSDIHRADYEKIINIFMALDPYDWHDFLVEQLKQYLLDAEDLTKYDIIEKEILNTLVDFSDTIEEEELLSRDIQKELAQHLEHDNVVFRNLCFKLIANASSHRSDITLNRLERLKLHEDWKIKLKAYQTKNKIMQWRKNRKLPMKLRLRKMLPF